MADDYTSTSGSAKPTPSKGAAASAGSPDEELKKLKEADTKDQADLAKLKKQMDERKAKIDGLEKIVAATGQVTTAFDAAMQSIKTDRLEIQEFLNNDLPQLEKQDEVKNNKAEIESRMKAVDSAIEKKDADRLTLEQKYQDEKKALDEANDDLKAKTQALDEVKGRQRVIQDKVAQARKLRQRINENASKPLAKYVLGLELKNVWEQTKPLFITKEELEKTYYAKADEARAAAATAAAQDEKFKASQTAVEAGRKELDALKASRLDDMIKKVGELSAPAPAGAGSGVLVGAGAKG
jgi:DNA repair exonuclease SbcCD ATPase subunit